MCEYDLNSGPRKLLYTVPKIFYIAIFVLAILHFRIFLNRDSLYDHDVAQALMHIFTNYDQQPIQSITVSTDRSCGSKYFANNLYLWGGTSSGCFCSSTSNIFNQTCSAAGYPSCSSVSSTSSAYVKEWRGNSICIQRTSTLKYVAYTNSCPSNMVRCSPTTCIDTSESCPITDVKIIGSNDTYPDTYGKVDLGNNYSLIYTSVYNRDFINDIRVSFYDKPCLVPSKRPLPTKGTGYPLLTIPDSGCGFYQGVDEAFFIDAMNISDVLSDNNINISSSLPLFSNFENGEYAYLVGMKRYTVKYRINLCNNITSQVFINLAQEERNFQDEVMGLSWAIIIMCSLEFFIILFELILRAKVGNERNMLLKWVCYFDLFFFFIICVMVILEIGLILQTRSRVQPLIYYVADLVENLCFQQNEANSLLLMLSDSFSSDLWVLIGIGIAMLCVAVVGLFFMLFPLVIDWCAARDEEMSFYSDVQTSVNKKQKGKKGKQFANIEMLLKA